MQQPVIRGHCRDSATVSFFAVLGKVLRHQQPNVVITMLTWVKDVVTAGNSIV